jgi:hypothetical protein
VDGICAWLRSESDVQQDIVAARVAESGSVGLRSLWSLLGDRDAVRRLYERVCNNDRGRDVCVESDLGRMKKELDQCVEMESDSLHLDVDHKDLDGIWYVYARVHGCVQCV